MYEDPSRWCMYGFGCPGVDMGPLANRIAGAADGLRAWGHTVIDEGDVLTESPQVQRIHDEKQKYLPEAVRAYTLLASKVEKVPRSGGVPFREILTFTDLGYSRGEIYAK